MRTNSAARNPLLVVYLIAFSVISSLCPLLAEQYPSRRATSILDLFNQEAAATNPAGIHKYSEDLIGLLVPPGTEHVNIEPLANRLAQAEQAGREGKKKLVAEADVARAFNELMKAIGAQSSLRTDESSIRQFREYAASIKAFPSLLTADRNGANCNPGEAVFLIYLLISNNGVLHEGNLDSAQALLQMNRQGLEGHGAARMEGLGLSSKEQDSSASGLLSLYPSHHSRNATVPLFNHVAGMLGF
jgi:hypothetical protein